MRSIYFRLSPGILDRLKREGWDITSIGDITKRPYMFEPFFPRSTVSTVKILGYGSPGISGTMKRGKHRFPEIDSGDAQIIKNVQTDSDIDAAISKILGYSSSGTSGTMKRGKYGFPDIDSEDAQIIKNVLTDSDIDAAIFENLFPDIDIKKITKDFRIAEAKEEAKEEAKAEKMILKIVFRETDIETLKEDSIPFAAHYTPHIRLLEILPPDIFLCFVVILGARNKWWMLRFWDFGVGRSISVGREHARFYNQLLGMLTIPHEWAGVEATPPIKVSVPKGVTPPRTVRVGLYRYPTASISVRVGSQRRSSYRLIEKIWEKFLLRL